MEYSNLSRAQLSYEYLHTNSTTHEFLFGALAELIDNARDAEATKIDIYSVPDATDTIRGGYMLCFLDDGMGMDPSEASDIITFGKSSKKATDNHHIGMYGNGLKSGSMRIANDLIMFTKKNDVLTAVFLSRTFHEDEQIEEVIVPIPSFSAKTKQPICQGPGSKEKHEVELNLILRYSPFKTKTEFLSQFDKISGPSGTLVILYNMKLLDNGLPELDVFTVDKDILLSSTDSGDVELVEERKSFRAYTAILYVDPRMKIYIQGHKVRTKRLLSNLFKPRCYKYSSARFKTKAENEAQKAQQEARSADVKAKEAESKAKNLESKSKSLSKDKRAELRKAQAVAADLRKEAQLKKQIADRKMKSLKDPKMLNFYFGMNIENRNQYGMFVYNCSRLIKMYQKVGAQQDGGVYCSGVVGIVDVPYLVLEPTHNKQDFADAKEFRHMMKAMGEHMQQYWKDIEIAKLGVIKFWESFGYISPEWKDPPSNEAKFVRKRAMQVNTTLQCDMCLKWRILSYSASNIGKTFPDKWVCSDNPDPSHNKCSASEQKMNVLEGVLKREVKSKEEKEAELAEEIRKKQEKLESMKKTTVVTSSKQIRENENEKTKQGKAPQFVISPPPAPTKSTPVIRKPVALPPKPQLKGAPATARSASSTRTSKAQTTSKPAVTKSTRAPTKRRIPESSEDEESSDEEEEANEEEEEEAPPPPKKKTTPCTAPKVTPKVPPKKPDPVVEKVESSLDSVDDSPNVPMDAFEQVSTEDEEDDEAGTKVELKIKNEWHAGVVVNVKKKEGKWKIKFDKNPRDKYDKWIDAKGKDLRILDNKGKPVGAASPASVSSHDTAAEAPTSSTSTKEPVAAESIAEELASGYRTTLRYFLPPNWVMDKEAVSKLSPQELVAFPLNDFFDHYEKGLRDLVNNFQTDASSYRTEAQNHKDKLSSVRRMIAKLLKSINEDFDIDPEADTEQVDELLAACVRQACANDSSTSSSS